MAAQRRDSLFDEPEPKRRMVHLKTKEECRLGNETIQVWTVELPSKHAEGILRVIKENIEGQDLVDLQHLRRFAKPKYLPEHVLGTRNMVKEMYAVPRAWENTPAAVMQAPGSTAWDYSTSGKARSTASGRPSTLHLLVCPTRIVSLRDLHALLLQHTPFCSDADSWAYPLEIKEITVPLLAPTSPQQATIWSDMYWPTFYRKTNPFGAHPASIQKAEEELQKPENKNIGINEALALAVRVGNDNNRRGIGSGSGCCIVERVEGQTQIIALAGDARYRPQANECANEDTGCAGSPMGHAIMRAVGMVGRKRLRCASQAITKAAAKSEGNFAKGGLEHDIEARDAFFLDLPITDLEKQFFVKDNLKPDGYLCLKLEIFLTHEPCIMCSMALVHSRVGRVIFKHRMPETGGLTSELIRNDSGPVGLGYGMCWRKELNWQFMCWEYMAVEEEGSVSRQDQRKVTEKYQEAEDTTGSKSANVTLSSFARMHV